MEKGKKLFFEKKENRIMRIRRGGQKFFAPTGKMKNTKIKPLPEILAGHI